MKRKGFLPVICGLIILFLLTISIITIKDNKSFANQNTNTITIKQETNIDTDEEFNYRIKAFKESTSEECIMIGSFAEHGTSGNGNEGGPDFSAYLDFELNGYSYSKNKTYYGPNYNELGTILNPGDVKYNALSSYLKESYYFITNKMVSTYYSVETLYESELEIIHNNKNYILYTNFDHFDDFGNGDDFYIQNIMAERNYQLWICERDTSYETLDLSNELGQPNDNGYYSFILKNGDLKTIEIPEGYTYEIQQLTPDGWKLVSINNDTSIDKIKGVSGEGINEYTFRNNIDQESETSVVNTGNLRISLTALGGSPEIEFDIKITLSDSGINGVYGDGSFTNGVATIKIKHNEEKEIKGLPENIEYEVEEMDVEGYTVTYTYNKGSIVKDVTKEVTIYNERDYNLYFKVIDSETSVDLHDWELKLDNNATLNESNNSISFKCANRNCKAYDKEKNIIDINYNNSFLNMNIVETKVPYGYIKANDIRISGYPNDQVGSFGRLDNTLQENSGYLYEFEKIDDYNGIIKIKNNRSQINIYKEWKYYKNFGKSVYNDDLKEYEWKVFEPIVPKDLKVSATFEIEFEGVKDGEYEIINAKEEKLIVKNNKGVFSINDIANKSKNQLESHQVIIKGLPENIKYIINEIEASSENNIVEWKLIKNERVDTSSYYGKNLYLFNTQDLGGQNIENTNKYKLNLTKKVINEWDKDTEYEFTIMPLFGYLSDAKRAKHIEIPGYGTGNVSINPNMYYSVWLHGEDGDKVVDKKWFADYIYRFWQLTIPKHDGDENYIDKRLVSAFSQLEKMNITDAGCSKTESMYGYEYICYANSNAITEYVNKINEYTNNFFEYEGKHVIESSKKLEKEFKKLGYNSIDEWLSANHLHSADNDEIIRNVEEFISCFTNAGWTVDDFRFLRIMNIEGLNQNYTSLYGVTTTKPLYELAQEEFAKLDGMDSNIIKYFYGRTFKLKNGESIELQFPSWFPYEFGVLILEKKTENMEFTQDKSILFAQQHVEVIDNDLIANVTYKNTYPIFEVLISKQDENGNNLSGAKLKITDKEGNDIDEWTSTDKEYTIRLIPGKYKIEEVEAPKGYEKAAPIEFEINKKGKIKVTSEEISDNRITVINVKIKESQKNEEPKKEQPTEPEKKETPTPPKEDEKKISQIIEDLPKTLDDIMTYVLLFGGSIIFIVLVALGINKTKKQKKGE